jgi:hypothetical protein
MSFLDRLFGRRPEPAPDLRPSTRSTPSTTSTGAVTDEQALARYRYMIRTAPPEEVEQAHAEAFAKLTPQQRAQVLRELGSAVPERERAAAEAANYDPRTMARAATRAEMRQPGVMERSLGGLGGGNMAGTLLSSLAGAFVGTMIAQQFFGMMHPQTLVMIDQGQDPAPDAAAGEPLSDSGDAGSTGDQWDTAEPAADDSADLYGDAGDTSDFGGDFGGDF